MLLTLVNVSIAIGSSAILLTFIYTSWPSVDELHVFTSIADCITLSESARERATTFLKCNLQQSAKTDNRIWGMSMMWAGTAVATGVTHLRSENI